MDNKNYIVIAIDFGSNSNKFLLANIKSNNYNFFYKDFVVHKISSIFNEKSEQKILEIISNYQKLLKKFFKKIRHNLDIFLKKNKNINYFYISSIGTEFYRNNKYETFIKKIIDLNELELNSLKLFLEKKYNKKVLFNLFKIISQDVESELVFNAINNLIKDIDNFVLVDLGGASTELIIKKNNYINKILLKTGAVYFDNQIDLNSIFLNSILDIDKNIENIILIGGSFVSLFFSLEKFKFFKKLKILNNKLLLFLANFFLANNNHIHLNFSRFFLFNIFRKILLIDKILNFFKKILNFFFIFILFFLIFGFICFLFFNINLKIYLALVFLILILIFIIIFIFIYITIKIDDFIYNLVDDILFKNNYIFLRKINFEDIIDFYTFIKPINDKEIEFKFWDLKNRGESIKNALIFTISLLNIIKPLNIYITNITLLEGLVLDIFFNTNITTKDEENNQY